MGEAQALVESILAQAGEEAEKILAAARAKAEERLAAAREELRQKEAALEAEAARRAALEERRIATTVELAIRRERLQAKAALLDEAFAEAYRALVTLPEEKQRAFLSRLLLAAVETGEEEVVVAPGERGKYEALLVEVNEELRRRGGRGGLRLAEDMAGPEGGFVLRGPEYTVDCSYLALLAERRSVLEPEVAKVLFGGAPVGG
ncbi:MAG: hypothetical protein GX493_03375 [Firmicutes bacterium]|nr:hypothetical protein [Bacillota bacterium]